jgi:F-box and WD-40 domain protein CDC4
VSRRWRELLNDDMTWKNLCDKHSYVYRRMSEDERDFIDPFHGHPLHSASTSRSLSGLQRMSSRFQNVDGFSSLPRTIPGDWALACPPRKRRSRPSSYRSHFKQKYMVESAWNKGGRCTQRHITPDQGVVTSLHLTPKYIVFAMDNARIHVYDTNGNNQRTLQGHVMGVWAMVPWGDILVSGGCDREVRVWNMATG